MPYLDEIVWGPIAPKWIGSYEAELHKIVERIVSGGYSRIVNVGCAEGYYAIGLASRMPGTEVFAFDIDPIARQQTARLASIVGVADRVNIRGKCTAASLEELIGDNTLLAIDIEGFEVQLLDPDKSRWSCSSISPGRSALKSSSRVGGRRRKATHSV
jgi:hypothetical protein